MMLHDRILEAMKIINALYNVKLDDTSKVMLRAIGETIRVLLKED